MVGATVILLFAYAAISNGQGSVSFDEVGLFSTEEPCHLTWSYNRSAPNGPSCWHTLKNYKKCGDLPQSPINIETDKVENDNSFEPKYDNVAKPLDGTLENTGYAPKFSVTDLRYSYILSKVPSRPEKKFTLEQFHMHFHQKLGEGSEHRINCKGYDGELHFVHKENGLANDATVTHENFVVLAIFVTRAKGKTKTDQGLRPFFENLKDVTDCGGTKNITIYGLPFLDKLGKLYTYKGTLTTPGCDAGVTWLIKKEPINVSESDNLMPLNWDNKTNISVHGNVRPTFPMDPPLVLANFEPNEKNNNNYVNDNHDSSDDDDENRHACTNWLEKPECKSMGSR